MEKNKCEKISKLQWTMAREMVMIYKTKFSDETLADVNDVEVPDVEAPDVDGGEAFPTLGEERHNMQKQDRKSEAEGGAVAGPGGGKSPETEKREAIQNLFKKVKGSNAIASTLRFGDGTSSYTADPTSPFFDPELFRNIMGRYNCPHVGCK
jgi:hypothetical protein